MPSPKTQSSKTSFPLITTLIRFVSCGVLSIATGATWRFVVAMGRPGMLSAFSGIFFLLVGFIVGGLLWYLRDSTLGDERKASSFVVFVGVPLAVLTLVGFVWLVVFALTAL